MLRLKNRCSDHLVRLCGQRIYGCICNLDGGIDLLSVEWARKVRLLGFCNCDSVYDSSTLSTQKEFKKMDC